LLASSQNACPIRSKYAIISARRHTSIGRTSATPGDSGLVFRIPASPRNPAPRSSRNSTVST
jgi:hypothetical protein